MYPGFWLREAQSAVFYEVLRLRGVQFVTDLWERVGPLKKTPVCVGGGGEGEGGRGS